MPAVVSFDWSTGNGMILRSIMRPLKDRVAPGVRVLFVGINPGIRSATLGHHFAGYSNRFWKLLYESRLVPEPIATEDDVRLPEWGYGITNLVARETPGIDTLRPDEFVRGLRTLRHKVRRWRPHVIALVGVTLARVLFDLRGIKRVNVGLHGETFEGARVFVLPNPSGRNANFSYLEMLTAFRDLRRMMERSASAERPPTSPAASARVRAASPASRTSARRRAGSSTRRAG